MGVKGLQYYIENHCPRGIRNVSIVDMAKTYGNLHKCEPVLAVDGMSVLHRLYKMDDLEWLYGGQWKQYVQNFKLFVQRFRDEGIELVFIFDGVVDCEKTREWIDRRIEKLKDVRKIFDHIVQHNTYPDERLSQLPASMATLIRYALRCHCQCSVINSVIDVDKEIAIYAKNNRSCFAILSQDSDYIIFDSKPYLSVQHLKLGSLETVEYYRGGLAHHLGIGLKLLPLLACLMGNDYVHVDNVRAFHRHLTASKERTSVEDVVPKIAEYIRRSGWSGQIARNSRTLARFSENVGLAPETLIKGLKYYVLTSNNFDKPLAAAEKFIVPNLLATMHRQHGTGRMNSQIYNVLSQHSHRSSECLEDQKSTGLLPSAVIFRQLRLRMYYLLFGTSDVEIEELSAVQGVPILMEKVKPDAFTHFDKHPLEVLWYPQSKYRWQTVTQAMGVKVPEYKMNSRQFLGFACLINYLLLNNIGDLRLAAWEVNALVAQAVSPMAQDLEAIRRLKVPVIEPRAVHLATIILRGITTLISLMQVCAEHFAVKLLMPWNVFDGKLFHYLYLMAKAGATVEDLVFNDDKAVRELYQLRMMSVAGTYIVEERYKQ